MGADDKVSPFPAGSRGRLSPTNSDVEAESAQAAEVRDLTERIAAGGVGAGDPLTALRGMTGPGSFGVFDREPGGFDQPVSYTHLRAHETPEHLVCRLLLEKKNNKNLTAFVLVQHPLL